MSFSFKNLFADLFDKKADKENDITEFFKLYGSYFIILTGLYFLIEIIGSYTDYKVSFSIIYNLTGSEKQANTGGIIFTMIIHGILIYAGNILFKIVVNKLHKEEQHKPVYHASLIFVSLALMTSLTLNIFADGWTNAEVRKQTEETADLMDRTTGKAQKVAATLFTNQEQQFKADTARIGATYREKRKIIQTAANARQKRYNDTKDGYHLTLKQTELSKLVPLLEQENDEIEKAKSRNYGKVEHETEKSNNAMFASFGLREKIIKDTEENKGKNTWFIRIVSTILQLIGLAITRTRQILIRNGNQTRAVKVTTNQTKAKQTVFQGVTKDKNGNNVLDGNTKSVIRNWFKRGFGKPQTDNWKLFELVQTELEKHDITIQIVNRTTIEFYNDVTGQKI